MVFKGFTDENGNVIPVQGAGTVYNEQKNSLALGKDTSAIGQDQFVFGRRNVEDADKVEIVGGIINVLASTYFDYNSSLSVGDTGVHWLGHPSNIEETAICLGHSADDIISFWNSKGYTSIKVFDFPDEEVAFILSTTMERPGANITLVTKSKKVYNGVHWSSGSSLNSLHTYTFELEEADNVIYWETVEPMHTEHTIQQPANIRTLDWEGNEILEGSLAIGEGSVTNTKGQLVFGRKNVQDVTKVEIVGGGAENITVTKDGSNAKVGDVLLVKFTRAGNEETLRVSVIGKTLQEANNNTQDIIAFIDNSTSSDTDIPSYVTPLLFCKCIDKSSSIEKYMLVYYDNSHNSISVDLTTYENAGTHKYAFVVGQGLIAAYDVVSINAYINKGNIRTLDWAGNEELAGSLTVGKGITIGETSLTEEQLIALKALLNS